MNRIYRLVFSKTLNAWVAVSEISRGNGKKATRAKAASALLLAPLCLSAHAAPTGGIVTSGVGRVIQTQAAGGAVDTTITQSSQNLNLNWTGFNVGSNETVTFNQPNSSAVAVNRIYDTSGAQIMGRLNANGQVYLIDPNGILFGKGAQVNVGGLVASTMNLTGSTANTQSLGGNSTASVQNFGTIKAGVGGYVSLLGHTVSNEGTVTAQLGTVSLAGGSAFTLTFSGNQLLNAVVTQSQLNDLAKNGGLISANGGQVIMTAGARDALMASMVNNDGIIEAQSVSGASGRITLLGGMKNGTVTNDGTLDASATQGSGGFIDTSAHAVQIGDKSVVTTAAQNGKSGTWLIDPVDFTIASSGGDISGSTLSGALGSGNVVIQSSQGATPGTGSINVNDNVAWSANTLTLTAADNINVNATMSATGTAGLNLNPATANGSEAAVSGGQVLVGMNSTGFIGQVNLASTANISINGTPYTIINTLGAPGSMTGTDLQGIAGNLAGHYVLGSNIDASPTSTWNAGNGFASIGHWTTPEFTGTINGLGHTIDNMTLKLASGNVGFISDSTGGTIINTGIVGGTFVGNNQVGSLVGAMSSGLVANDYSTASVSGVNGVGGLVGYMPGGEIANSFTTGAVTGSHEYTGGVVGNVAASAGLVTNVWSSATVNGDQMTGGVVGGNYGTVEYSYATGNVTSSYRDAGGFVGMNLATILNDYATGNVASGNGGGTCGSGGFAGWNSGSITNSYATGSATGYTGVWTAGFSGVNGATGTISNSYSVGRVIPNGSTTFGGFIGANDNTSGGITGSFWDTTTSGLTTSYGGIGMTTAQMQTKANFTSATSANGNVNPNWDFTTPVWGIKSGNYPVLCSFGGCTTTVYVDPLNGSSTYGSAPVINYDFVNGSGSVVSLTNASVIGAASYTSAPTASSNAGSYSFNYASGLSLAGTGAGNYTLAPWATSTSWIVNPATLTYRANSVSRTYGSANPSLTGTLSGFVNGQTQATATTGTVTFGTSATSTSNVGNYSITGSGLTSNSSNYVFAQAAGNATALTVNPAPVTVSGLSGTNRVYNGSTLDALSGTAALNGTMGGQTLTVSNASTGTLSSANAGTESVATNIVLGNGTGLASNYYLVQPNLTANISPAILIASIVGDPTKTYDGTTTAPLTASNYLLSGFVSGQGATVNQVAGVYNSKNVATANTVTAFMFSGDYAANGGTLLSNYVLPTTATGAGNITPKSMMIVATGTNKVYDGTTNDAVVLGGIGVFQGDQVVLTDTSATFANKNVGTNKTVTVSGLGLAGADAGNYSVTDTAAFATASITPATLTYNATKTTWQQGGAEPNLSGTVSGFVGGDSLLNATTGTLDWTSTASGSKLGKYAIDGSGLSATNYVFNQNTNNAKALTIAPQPVMPEQLTGWVAQEDSIFDYIINLMGSSSKLVTSFENSTDMIFATMQDQHCTAGCSGAFGLTMWYR